MLQASGDQTGLAFSRWRQGGRAADLLAKTPRPDDPHQDADAESRDPHRGHHGSPAMSLATGGVALGVALAAVAAGRGDHGAEATAVCGSRGRAGPAITGGGSWLGRSSVGGLATLLIGRVFRRAPSGPVGEHMPLRRHSADQRRQYAGAQRGQAGVVAAGSRATADQQQADQGTGRHGGRLHRGAPRAWLRQSPPRAAAS